MTIANSKGIMQILPALETGGTERVVISVAIKAQQMGYRSYVVSNGGPMVRELKRAGVEHIEMPVHKKNMFTINSRAKKLRNLMEKHDISLIHAHSRLPAWLAYKATKNTDIAFMNTCHGYFNLQNALKIRYSRIVGMGDRVIAVSKFINQHLRDLGTDPANIRNIPLGVQMETYDAENVSQYRMVKLLEEWDIPEDAPIVMLPGRISRTKGHDVLIKAIKQGRKDIRYLLVGNYQNRPRVKKMLDELIEENDVGNQVQFTGLCRDMPAAYRICDLVVVPSTWPEPGGTVAIEAQAIGKPVIVSDAGGMAESVLEGKTGFIVEAGNHQNLAETIDRVMNFSESEREALSKNAMQHTRSQFTNDLMCERYMDVYRELLEASSPNPELIGFPHLTSS